jgi:glycosyltransferase involved in cell wall biosynthesis
MRILHVSETLGAGGKERQIVELLRGLVPHRDVQSFVAAMSDEEFFQCEIERELAYLIPHLRKGRRDLRPFKRLYDLVTGLNIDVVHSWGSMCSVYSAPVVKLCGIAFVNGFVRDAPPHMTLRNKNYSRGKLTVPFSDIVVANSRAGLSAYHIPERKGVCIYNGFNPDRISNLADAAELRATLGIRTTQVVGMVASFTTKKDYAAFVEMARRVCLIRDDVTFVAVGDGATLEQVRASVPPECSERIKFLGKRRDVESIANLFTVGVLVTNSRLHGEGISNALMECMALGKPVVATNDGGTPELVLEGQTGFLVPSQDTEALTDRVLHLLDSSELANQFGTAGRRRIETAFSLDAMTNAYLRVYRKVTDRRRAANSGTLRGSLPRREGEDEGRIHGGDN